MIKEALLICIATTLVGVQSAPHRKDIPAIAKKANGAVVSIVVSDKSGHPVAQGSGFLISEDGQIVTNYHVIRTGSSAVVKLPSGAFFLVDGILASDEGRDIALIKANGNNFQMLTLGDSGRIKVGEEVVAIGSPLSLESTVSNGIVSGIRTFEKEGGRFLQITVPISPGSSGGPLFNMAGEVVGITTSHLEGGENLNFAIPINDVKTMLLTRLSTPHSLPDGLGHDKNGVSLKEAIAVMNRMMEPEHHYIASLESTECSVTIASREPYRIMLPVSVYEKDKDQYGTIHYGFKYSVYEEQKLVTFDLGDIDPDSINLRNVPSPKFVEENHPGEHPEVLKHPDLTRMVFTTRDLKKSVVGEENVKLGGTFIVFESEDRAQRFVNAFVHSVRACGGRASEFAPQR